MTRDLRIPRLVGGLAALLVVVVVAIPSFPGLTASPLPSRASLPRGLAAAPSPILSEKAASMLQLSVRPAVDPIGSWKNITGPSGGPPPARQNYAMGYDPLLHAVILFGGQDSSGGALNDTWAFTSGGWSQPATGRAPPGRWGAGFAYDPGIGAMVLFGGNVGGVLSNDTWTYRASGWTQLSTPIAPPSQIANSFVYDSVDQYLLLVNTPSSGSTVGTWKFDGTHWANLTAQVTGQPPFLGYRTTDDPADGFVLLYGGSSPGCANGLSATWAYAHGTYLNLTAQQTVLPPVRVGVGTMTYDPNAGGVLMFAGYLPSCTVVNETWLFRGGQWSNLTSNVGLPPPGRWDARLAYLPETESTIVFSGNERHMGGANQFGSDTWNYSLSFRARASASPTQGAAPLAVQFTSNPVGGASPHVYTYAWSFGDGQPGATTRDANHTYSGPGTFLASLNVTDITGAVAVAAFVEFVSPGTFGLTANATPTSGLAPLTVAFSAAATGGTPPYGYQWSFGGTLGGATQANVTETYTSAGTYAATLIAVDSGSHQLTKNFTILVVGPLTGVSVSASPSTGPPPLNVTFRVVASGGRTPFTFAWSFGDRQTSTLGPNVSHQYATAGTFRVTVTISDAFGQSRAATTNVTVTSAGSTAPSSGLLSSPTTLLLLGAFAGAVAVAAAVGILLGRRRRPAPPGP